MVPSGRCSSRQPAPESFEQVMFSAQAFEVGRVGRPERVGDGVVDVRVFGGVVAAGEPARHVAAADEPGQRCRGAVSRFGGRVGGVLHGPHRGAGADEFGDQRGRDGAAADEVGRGRARCGRQVGFGVRRQRLGQGHLGGDGPRRALTGGVRVGLGLEGGGFGDHMDDDGGGPRVGAGGGAVGLPAPAGQVLAAGGQASLGHRRGVGRRCAGRRRRPDGPSRSAAAPARRRRWPAGNPTGPRCPTSSSAGAITTSRPRAPARLRRRAAGSWRSTMASMAWAVLVTVRRPKRAASLASAASTSRRVSGSLIRSVCQTMALASRALIAPSANRAPTRGRRSRSATARYICPEAMAWLIPWAAATSAAIASQLSHDQWAQSVGPSARRATSSAMAASRRAAAAASALAQLADRGHHRRVIGGPQLRRVGQRTHRT